VLKLGKSGKVIHHAAHKPGHSAGCYLSTPEGALHFNTKMFIAEQLRNGKRLLVQQRCANQSNSWPCESYLSKLWQSEWDRVEVEHSLASIRPDIVLLKGGNPAAAIEICVSHEVDALKADKLTQLGIPWIEVKATGTVFDERFAYCDVAEISDEIVWNINQPIQYERISPPLEEWTCWRCLYESRTRQIQHERVEKREQVRIQNIVRSRLETIKRKEAYHDEANNRVKWARAFEFVSEDGKESRFDLFVVERYEEGRDEPVEIYIKNRRLGAEIMFSQEPADHEGKELLNKQFLRWLREMKGKCPIFRPLTTGWVSEEKYERQIATVESPFEKLLKNIPR